VEKNIFIGSIGVFPCILVVGMGHFSKMVIQRCLFRLHDNEIVLTINNYNYFDLFMISNEYGIYYII